MHEGKRTSGMIPTKFFHRRANARLAECTEPQDEQVMIVAAKKSHCRSGTKLITNNGAMQAQTNTSCTFPKKELNEVQMKRASTWPLPIDSVLVSRLPCWFLGLLGWRFLGCLTTTVSVVRVLASGGCEIFDASRTLSLINANLGSKDIQREVTVVAKKIFEEVVVLCAGRNGALLEKRERTDEETE